MEEQKISARKISLKSGNDIALVKLGGYVDQVSITQLEKVLDLILRKQIYRIVVDLTQAEYVGSAGWGVFLSELRTIRHHGGDLKLVGMNPNVYEVFELLELGYILDATSTFEEAIVSLVETETPTVV